MTNKIYRPEKKLYSIFDKKTTTFLAPTLHLGDQEAMRQLDHAILKNNAGLLSDYPDDYSLYAIAEFDNSFQQDEKCMIVPIYPPVLVTEVATLPAFKRINNE